MKFGTPLVLRKGSVSFSMHFGMCFQQVRNVARHGVQRSTWEQTRRGMLGQAGRGLAFRTPRAMECVCGDRTDTLSTTTAFTTMRMVTTSRKVRYLLG